MPTQQSGNDPHSHSSKLAHGHKTSNHWKIFEYARLVSGRSKQSQELALQAAINTTDLENTGRCILQWHNVPTVMVTWNISYLGQD